MRAARDRHRSHARRLIRDRCGRGQELRRVRRLRPVDRRQTTAALEPIREAIATTDVAGAPARASLNLVRLEAEPALVEAFLREHVRRSPSSNVPRGRRSSRPGPAEYSGSRMRCGRPGRMSPTRSSRARGVLHRRARVALVRAGTRRTPAGARSPTSVEALRRRDRAGLRSRCSTTPAVMRHERTRARPADVRARPAAGAGAGVPARPGAAPRAARAIIKVLGFAGAGYESVLAEQLEHGTSRPGGKRCRRLAHIGSTARPRIVGVHLHTATSAVRAAAEEALRHFPPAAAAAGDARSAREPRVRPAASADRRPPARSGRSRRDDRARAGDARPGAVQVSASGTRRSSASARRARHARATAMTRVSRQPPPHWRRRPIRSTC